MLHVKVKITRILNKNIFHYSILNLRGNLNNSRLLFLQFQRHASMEHSQEVNLTILHHEVIIQISYKTM